jgi:hypothetical protein
MSGPKDFEKIIFNDPTLFLHFCDYLPFEENYGPQFEKKRSSFTQG